MVNRFRFAFLVVAIPITAAVATSACNQNSESGPQGSLAERPAQASKASPSSLKTDTDTVEDLLPPPVVGKEGPPAKRARHRASDQAPKNIVEEDPPPPRVKPSEDDIARVIEGNTQFALELFDRLSKTGSNFVASPLSISAGMAMVYAGARGGTALRMQGALHFLRGGDMLHAVYDDLLLRAKAKGVKLAVANRLWVQQGYDLKKPFVQTMATYYGTGPGQLDLIGDGANSVATINAWVAKHTEGQIGHLLRSVDAYSSTRLLLTNAVFFEGEWSIPFREGRTHPAAFSVGRGGTVQVPFMSRDGVFRHGRFNGCQVLTLLYRGHEMDMVLILPPEGKSPNGMGHVLSRGKLSSWLDQLEKTHVKVFLPKFSISLATDLEALLKAQGATTLFGPDADLSGMSGPPGLFLGAAVHRAVITVDERGTRAAATTESRAEEKAERKWEVFRADRPFMFLIRDRRNNSILFIGRVMNPSL